IITNIVAKMAPKLAYNFLRTDIFTDKVPYKLCSVQTLLYQSAHELFRDDRHPFAVVAHFM
ncbi:hypothetical protein, partial [Vibrio sp. 1569]|uniref:hypothetical protein n=1 Tax=Vibrio sp. 1569 TaxID=3074565 RepID=UPI002964739D